MPESWIDDILGDEQVRPEFEAALRSRMLASAARRRPPRWMLPAAAALVAVAGIGTVVAMTSRRDDGPSVHVEPSTGPSSPPISTSPSVATSAPVVTSVVPVPPESSVPATPPVSTSLPPASDAPESTPTSPTVPAPPRARVAGAMDIQAGAVFGHSILVEEPVDAVVDDIASDLGRADVDTGWQPGWACIDEWESRLVRWGDLRLVFIRANGSERLMSWRLGDPEHLTVDDAGPDVDALAPTGLATPSGLGVGSAASELDAFQRVSSDSLMTYVGTDWGDVAFRIVDGRIAGIGAGPRVCEQGEGEDSTDPGVQLTIGYGHVFGMWAGMEQRPDSVVAHVSRTLGAPTADGGWQTVDACGGPYDVRLVRWNDFQMVFGRSADREYLSSWRLGDPANISIDPLGPELGPFPPTGVADSRGIGIGSPVSVLDALPAFARTAEQVVLDANGQTVIVNVRDGLIVGIGAGPLDCGGSHDTP